MKTSGWSLFFLTVYIAGAANASYGDEADLRRPMITVHPQAELIGAETPWTRLDALDSTAEFHFAVVTDRTGGHREGVWADAMAKLNLTRPAFVVSVGDLIEGYTEDRVQLTEEWDEFDAMVNTLDAPFFYTPGNHDYSNEVMTQVWRERYGPSYYSFEYKDTLFVVLNSSLFNTNVDDGDELGGAGAGKSWSRENKKQVEWFANTLSKHSEVRWTFVLMHFPYWRDVWWRMPDVLEWTEVSGPPPGDNGADSWNVIENMLSGRNYTAFAGHTHNYEYQADPVGPHVHERISLATTGGGSTLGSGSELKGPEYAEFDHYVWVTVTETGPVIANVLLNGLLPKDFDHVFKQQAGSPQTPRSDSASQ